MSGLSSFDARALLTKKVVEVYREMLAPTAFLRSYFQTKESTAKFISILILRGTEKVAEDVVRGSEGNRNTYSIDTEKDYLPGYYREFLEATDLSFYERLLNSNNTVDAVEFSEWVDEMALKIAGLQDKIERALEQKCSEVLETGVVILKNGVNIDMHRKAASIVDKGAGNYWATAAINPLKDLEAGGIFLRTKGKVSGGLQHALMGEDAYSDFINNPIVQAIADVRNFHHADLREPQRNAVGGNMQGTYAYGSYKWLIWTYPEYFDTETQENIQYLNPKKVVILPEAPRFTLAFAGIPQIMDDEKETRIGMFTPRKAAFHIGEYKDQRKKSHVFDVAAAACPILTAVDQVYTVKVVAG